VSADELQTFLDRCLSYQIMISSDGRYLSVAVHVPERAGEEPDRPLGAAPASERRHLTLIPGAPEHMQ
jgi:hypothetical protein